MNADPGYFGPDSMMWKVNKEITVLFGGARALLMHAAHPLIAAGARQTSFYQRDPWKRLIRTLSLQNSVTFGTIEEANDSATRINKLHEVIIGEVLTGGLGQNPARQASIKSGIPKEKPAYVAEALTMYVT